MVPENGKTVKILCNGCRVEMGDIISFAVQTYAVQSRSVLPKASLHVARPTCIWTEKEKARLIMLRSRANGSSALLRITSALHGPESFLKKLVVSQRYSHLCKILGFHVPDYKECRLLGYKNLVHTSQKTHYVSATDPRRLMLLCKIKYSRRWLWRISSSEI
jgi:hypothetical protein